LGGKTPKPQPQPGIRKQATLEIRRGQTLQEIVTREVSGNITRFTGGQVKAYVENWRNLTTDHWIISTVLGCDIEFDSLPTQARTPQPIGFSERETRFVHSEIDKLLTKQIIEPATDCADQFISNFFLRPKKNGTYRFILNLSKLNPFITYHKFKMDSAMTVAELMTENCYMCSVDLTDAYYSIPVARYFRKYMRFHWNGEMYQFTCLPNGLSPAPRIFTKVLKPIYATLRSRGFISSGYIDDSYLQGDTIDECVDNVTETIALFISLGFTINWEKSVLVPTQRLHHLGFIYDSVTMTI
jgi:hypothetical protein